MTRLALVLGASWLLTASACFDTVIINGDPELAEPRRDVEADDRIYVGVLGGTLPLQRVDLKAICGPRGWSILEARLAPLDVIFNLSIVLGLQRASVRCTRREASEAHAPQP